MGIRWDFCVDGRVDDKWMADKAGWQAARVGESVTGLAWGPKILRTGDPGMMGRGLPQCGFGGVGGGFHIELLDMSVVMSGSPALCEACGGRAVA